MGDGASNSASEDPDVACTHLQFDSVPFTPLMISLLNTQYFLKSIILTAFFQICFQKLLEEEAIFLAPHYLFVSDKEREIICGMCG